MLKTKIHRISAIFSKQAPFYQNRVDFSDHAFWEKLTQNIENYQEYLIIGREHPFQLSFRSKLKKCLYSTS